MPIGDPNAPGPTGMEQQGWQQGKGWNPLENGGWQWQGEGAPTFGALGESMTNDTRAMYGLAEDPNQWAAHQPGGWGELRDASGNNDYGDFSKFNRIASPTSIYDYIANAQYDHAKTYGDTVNRPYNYDADTQSWATNAILNPYNQATGQNITLDQLPNTKYAMSLPAEHKGAGSILSGVLGGEMPGLALMMPAILGPGGMVGGFQSGVGAMSMLSDATGGFGGLGSMFNGATSGLSNMFSNLGSMFGGGSLDGAGGALSSIGDGAFDAAGSNGFGGSQALGGNMGGNTFMGGGDWGLGSQGLNGGGFGGGDYTMSGGGTGTAGSFMGGGGGDAFSFPGGGGLMGGGGPAGGGGMMDMLKSLFTGAKGSGMATNLIGLLQSMVSGNQQRSIANTALQDTALNQIQRQPYQRSLEALNTDAGARDFVQNDPYIKAQTDYYRNNIIPSQYAKQGNMQAVMSKALQETAPQFAQQYDQRFKNLLSAGGFGFGTGNAQTYGNIATNSSNATNTGVAKAAGGIFDSLFGSGGAGTKLLSSLWDDL